VAGAYLTVVPIMATLAERAKVRPVARDSVVGRIMVEVSDGEDDVNTVFVAVIINGVIAAFTKLAFMARALQYLGAYRLPVARIEFAVFGFDGHS